MPHGTYLCSVLFWIYHVRPSSAIEVEEDEGVLVEDSFRRRTHIRYYSSETCTFRHALVGHSEVAERSKNWSVDQQITRIRLKQ